MLLPSGAWATGKQPTDLVFSGVVVDESSLSSQSRDELDTFLKFLNENPRPVNPSFREEGRWLSNFAGNLPTVLLNLKIKSAPGMQWLEKAYVQNSYIYSSGEAALPLAFLASLWISIFTMDHDEVLLPKFDPTDLKTKALINPKPASIPLSPLLFFQIEAIEKAPAHVLTADLKAYLLLSLYHANDEAFTTWSDDESAIGLTSCTPKAVRKKIAEVLGNEYWITSNSVRMQNELLTELIFTAEPEFSSYFIDALRNSSWLLDDNKILLSRLSDALPNIFLKIAGGPNRARLVVSAFFLFKEVKYRSGLKKLETQIMENLKIFTDFYQIASDRDRSMLRRFFAEAKIASAPAIKSFFRKTFGKKEPSFSHSKEELLFLAQNDHKRYTVFLADYLWNEYTDANFKEKTAELQTELSGTVDFDPEKFSRKNSEYQKWVSFYFTSLDALIASATNDPSIQRVFLRALQDDHLHRDRKIRILKASEKLNFRRLPNSCNELLAKNKKQ